MRMSTALVNGNEAENRGQKFPFGDTVETDQASKMKNISSPVGDFEKMLASKLGEGSEMNGDEVANMKELLLIHLDYIQQQSEQLAKKNKQLEDKNIENELLKQRIVRMQRRCGSIKDLEEEKPEETTETPGSRKRRITAEPTTGKKSKPPADGSSSAKRGKQERSSTARLSPEPEEIEKDPDLNLDDVFTSRIAYHTLMGEKPNCLLKYIKRSKKQKPAHLRIEIPLWTAKAFCPSLENDGIEDFEDDVYDRRHSKLMHDEKRRKRWDVQRIREQRQIERLRSREPGHKRLKQPYQSLWPQYAEGLRFTVNPRVPVTVFGINIPATTTQDFCLPWKDGTRQVTSRRRTKR